MDARAATSDSAPLLWSCAVAEKAMVVVVVVVVAEVKTSLPCNGTLPVRIGGHGKGKGFSNKSLSFNQKSPSPLLPPW